MSNLVNLYGMFIPEIATAITPLGLDKYRATQIAEWMYHRGVNNFDTMTNLPIGDRQKLANHCTATSVVVKAQQHSIDGKTSKYLMGFPDEQTVETVLMRQHYGNSVCISTQVGCAMGCLFCASTLDGMIRDLTCGEILAQVLHIQHQLSLQGQKVNSVVIMGAGEPLMNYDNVLRFIRLCHESYTIGLSYRSFTLSTSGIVPAIDRLAQEGLPITLAVSLHASTDDLRTKLMPINRRYPLSEVLAAADRYADKSGRRVTYEYTLIQDTNDQPIHAHQLAALLKGRLANVNLIPVNPVPELNLHRPTAEQSAQFANILEKAGVQVTIRREMGTDIQAACGQLRKREIYNQSPL